MVELVSVLTWKWEEKNRIYKKGSILSVNELRRVMSTSFKKSSVKVHNFLGEVQNFLKIVLKGPQFSG